MIESLYISEINRLKRKNRSLEVVSQYLADENCKLDDKISNMRKLLNVIRDDSKKNMVCSTCGSTICDKRDIHNKQCHNFKWKFADEIEKLVKEE